MNEIIQMLILIILGLLGITRLQASKTKSLKQDVKKAEDAAKRKDKQMETLNEVQQKFDAIASEEIPERIEAPQSGDTAGRLDRLNRLHERANSPGE
jgi:predicted Holliday junction resolvase-like endonuclease